MTYSELRALLTKRFSLPKERTLRRAIRSFSAAEKSVFYALVGIFVFSAAGMLYKVSAAYTTEVPSRGGTLTEGIVGNPRFINPVLALSEADKTLTALVYSGLERLGPDGSLQTDLASSIDISKDGLTYTAHLRPDAVFQDGTPVTADDVVFTINKIEDDQIKSPIFGDWSGVAVQKVDDETLRFVRKSAYAPFIDNLTVGILPKHIWKDVSDDEFAFSVYNTLPVGSGPYQVDNVTRNSGGIPDYYELKPFQKSVSGEPYISSLVFRFYPSENDLLAAYGSGDVDSISGISPSEAKLVSSDASVLSSPLPRIFGVFFNQGANKALADVDVRKALDLAAPKQEIVKDVLDGYATPIDSPLPPSLFPYAESNAEISDADRFAQAAALLEKDGWQKNADGVLEKKSGKDIITLSFSISTGDAAELRAVADKLKAAWQKLGAQVDVQVFETGDLNQNVIRPRRYEALLFGEVVGADADLYPFWDSSERNDPGLNVAMYASSKVDKLLEDARIETDSGKREADYKAFDAQIRQDMPLVSLYAPNFIYVMPKGVAAVSLANLSDPSDRFASVRDWYLETDDVWQIFNR